MSFNVKKSNLKLPVPLYYILLLMLCSYSLSAKTHYPPQTISSQSLVNFQSNSPHVKKAIELGLELAGQNIGYQYGSADPKSGGIDCSGAMYYLLTRLGIKSVPRSSESLYQWIKKEGFLYPNTANDLKSTDFAHLKPGDLLFWSGTYDAPGNTYVTHVMMYIGKTRQGEHLMVGSSNGRTYKGKQIYGLSVFDFLLPSSTSKSKFLGYSCIPQFSCKAP